MMGILGKEGLNLAKASFQDNLEKKEPALPVERALNLPATAAEQSLLWEQRGGP